MRKFHGKIFMKNGKFMRIDHDEWKERERDEREKNVKEKFNTYKGTPYLVKVFSWTKKDRWFGHITHRVKFRPFTWRMVHLVQLLPPCRRQFPLGCPSLLIPCLPLSTLQ